MSIGQDIKRVRLTHGLSQEYLCGNSGFPITKSTLIRWEAGKTRRIPIEALQAFAMLHRLSFGEYLQELGINVGIDAEIKRGHRELENKLDELGAVASDLATQIKAIVRDVAHMRWAASCKPKPQE